MTLLLIMNVINVNWIALLNVIYKNVSCLEPSRDIKNLSRDCLKPRHSSIVATHNTGDVIYELFMRT